MEAAGLAEVKGQRLDVRICKNGQPSLQIDGKVPRRYYAKVEPKADSKAIKEALLSGKSLHFARLIYGNHIRIN